MTGVSKISGPKYVLGPRVVGKLSFRQWDFRFNWGAGWGSETDLWLLFAQKMHSSPPAGGKALFCLVLGAVLGQAWWMEGCRTPLLLFLPLLTPHPPNPSPSLALE